MSKMRIDKLLANMGVGSRSEVKKFAKLGLIKVNGLLEKNPGKIIDTETDKVSFDDQEINYIEFIYLMMNKPGGVISATTDNYDETVIDLLDDEYLCFDPFPVGRLDKDTEGLLLITNDGHLAHSLLTPKNHVDKEYYVEAEGSVTDQHIAKFAQGMQMEGYFAMPAKLVLVDYDPEKDLSYCRVTIHEGKFHQVKNMFASVKLKVTYLKRIRMGSLKLYPNLELGSYRELTEEELENLKKNL